MKGVAEVYTVALSEYAFQLYKYVLQDNARII